MRGYGNAERQAAQANAAASAAAVVRAASVSAAAADGLAAATGDITGGASQTIADLKARMDAAGIPP